MSLEIEVRGVRYPVEVSETGLFSTEIAGGALRADTLAGLRDKAQTRTAHADLDIPFTYCGKDESWQGRVRRMHANGRDLLVTREGGGAVTVPAYESKRILTRLDESEFAELLRLQAAVAAAETALEAFRAAHQRNIRREILGAEG